MVLIGRLVSFCKETPESLLPCPPGAQKDLTGAHREIAATCKSSQVKRRGLRMKPTL